MKRLIPILIALGALSACSDAKNSAEVAPQYVPTSTYSSMSCKQLRAEAELIRSQTPALAAAVEKSYKHDKNMEAVTWILFWPAAFAMHGNDAETAQLATAKGQIESIGAVMRSKGCK